jgi:PBP1b-binding outer membrane lipoprotein LpoB
MATINLHFLCSTLRFRWVVLLLWGSGCAKPKQAQMPPPEVEFIAVEPKDVPLLQEVGGPRWKAT